MLSPQLRNSLTQSNQRAEDEKRFQTDINRFAETGDEKGYLDYVYNQVKPKYAFNRGIYDIKGFRNLVMDTKQRQLSDAAQDFAKNAEGYKASQYGMLKNEVTQNLDRGLDQTRKNYSARGLLYSGLRQGTEGQQRAQAGGLLAQGRADINKEVEGRKRAMSDVAAQFRLQGYQNALQQQKELFEVQLQNAVRRRQAAASLGQGLGYAAGAAYGNMGSKGQEGGGGFTGTGAGMGTDFLMPMGG